uniref:Poly(U)-binding-splicing factor PUF60 n=1 Tax=Haemonchus placei TaxID=6290 RepID=A0A0N4W455_HAEPC
LVAMPVLQQHGDVFVGPGSKREAQLLGLGLTKLSSRRKDDLQLAKRYAMDLSIKQIMLRQQKAHHENQQKQAMYAQALSLMARVYIGSISFEVREEMIKKAFEVYGPIKSINMSWDPTTGHHKGFAFLEFDVPEAALLAQESMNGQLMGGRNLKVGRPSNMPQAQPIIEMVQQDAKKYHRVYVSSVHPDLSESDLKSVFEAFGEVVKCQLARQSATGKGSHRGFGYIEFNNAAAMNEAIAGMNMFDLGGQFLRVGRCITPPEALTYLQPQTQAALPTAAAQAAAMERILERTKAKQDAKLALPVTFGAIDPLFAPKDPLEKNEESGGNCAAGQNDTSEPQKKKKRVVEAKKIQPKLNTAQALAAAAKAGELSDAVINEQMNSEDATLASQEGLAIRGNDARHLLMAKLMRTNRSTVLVLRNMVNPEDIDEYLEDEIKEECSKYGDVQEVVIANDQTARIVKIFVRFADPKQVDAARAALDKRFFSGNTVSAEIYDQAMFDHNDLSG